MAAVVPEGRAVWGVQLPVQAQSTRFAEPWEADGTPEDLAAVVRAAEQAGAWYVAVCDHLAVPEDLVPTMGATWWHTVATLGWVAAMTERVRLLSHVAVPAYRHPLESAKAYGTLDHLSDGRVVVGVGAGHVEGEFAALGVPMAARGRALDEVIDAVRGVWSDAPATGWWDGPGGRLAVAPAPRQPGGPPVWIGGSSPAALRRVVARGDGWLPQGPPPQGMARAVAELTEQMAEHRPGERLDVGINAPAMYVGDAPFPLGPHDRAGSPDELAERLRRIVAVGADHVAVRLRSRSAKELCEQLDRFGRDVWPLVEGDR
ncbi:MAG: TIGR03619 family F420-dependent LLM class oxidoreductase [Acidimicrobiia bacterium]|nr:TIGR03619 family F420-dependent LLM class oxidoreductase [Acidimicrobiia bacterium]